MTYIVYVELGEHELPIVAKECPTLILMLSEISALQKFLPVVA